MEGEVLARRTKTDLLSLPDFVAGAREVVGSGRIDPSDEASLKRLEDVISANSIEAVHSAVTSSPTTLNGRGAPAPPRKQGRPKGKASAKGRAHSSMANDKLLPRPSEKLLPAAAEKLKKAVKAAEKRGELSAFVAGMGTRLRPGKGVAAPSRPEDGLSVEQDSFRVIVRAGGRGAHARGVVVGVPAAFVETLRATAVAVTERGGAGAGRAPWSASGTAVELLTPSDFMPNADAALREDRPFQYPIPINERSPTTPPHSRLWTDLPERKLVEHQLKSLQFVEEKLDGAGSDEDNSLRLKYARYSGAPGAECEMHGVLRVVTSVVHAGEIEEQRPPGPLVPCDRGALVLDPPGAGKTAVTLAYIIKILSPRIERRGPNEPTVLLAPPGGPPGVDASTGIPPGARLSPIGPVVIVVPKPQLAWQWRKEMKKFYSPDVFQRMKVIVLDTVAKAVEQIKMWKKNKGEDEYDVIIVTREVVDDKDTRKFWKDTPFSLAVYDEFDKSLPDVDIPAERRLGLLGTSYCSWLTMAKVRRVFSCAPLCGRFMYHFNVNKCA